jgi:hypothetical protein
VSRDRRLNEPTPDGGRGRGAAGEPQIAVEIEALPELRIATLQKRVQIGERGVRWFLGALV